VRGKEMFVETFLDAGISYLEGERDIVRKERPS
jgi:hypothetical protein